MRTNRKQKIMSALLSLPMTAVILAACHGGNNGGNINHDYPLPGPEESAVMKLCDTLMSQEGQTLTGAQLAVMRYGVDFHPDTFGIDLPVTDIDERPEEGAVYTNEGSGGTLIFHYDTTFDDEVTDSIGPIGTVDMRTVVHSWSSSESLPDSAETNRLRARGNSIYTPYRWVHTGRRKSNNYTPRWFGEYHGGIIYVYPGADSLILTYGYEESKRIYKR
ncbi:MAG: hypothetical protein IKP43_03960 [Bacteroidaceae bacterium]|nr:hypothetical protein [Bacteroidaceae bacterium]